MLRPLPSNRTGLPRLPVSPFQRAVPITSADQVGANVDIFPTHAAFPVIQAGQHPHHHFRGLLRLHTRYGPLDCSTAQGGLCHEASAHPVTRKSRSSATRLIDFYLRGSFLHWWYAPSGRTELDGLRNLKNRILSEQQSKKSLNHCTPGQQKSREPEQVPQLFFLSVVLRRNLRRGLQGLS